RSAVDVRAAPRRRRCRRRCRAARVEQCRDEGASGEFAAVSQFVPPAVPGPPDGRAGFRFSSAVVLGSLRCKLSECGYFVSGNADGSFVVVVGPAHPTAPMPISNTTAHDTRDFVMVGHLRDERSARLVPVGFAANGIAVAATRRWTTMVRAPQWPREFLDRRLRTIEAVARRRRDI